MVMWFPFLSNVILCATFAKVVLVESWFQITYWIWIPLREVGLHRWKLALAPSLALAFVFINWFLGYDDGACSQWKALCKRSFYLFSSSRHGHIQAQLVIKGKRHLKNLKILWGETAQLCSLSEGIQHLVLHPQGSICQPILETALNGCWFLRWHCTISWWSYVC